MIISEYKMLKYLDKFKDANTSLINTIEKSISQYYKNKSADFDELPNYQTPRPWENKVIKTLNNYQNDIQKSINKYSAGDSEPLLVTTSILGGLSKNLDNFDTCWMTDTYKDEYLTNLDYLIEIADNIESAL